MAEDMDVDLRSMLDVQREIDGVQRKIDDVDFQLSILKDPEEKKYLREKEKQLRDEEKQLRDEEKQLRDEKMQLRALQLEKEKQRTLAKGPVTRERVEEVCSKFWDSVVRVLPFMPGEKDFKSSYRRSKYKLELCTLSKRVVLLLQGLKEEQYCEASSNVLKKLQETELIFLVDASGSGKTRTLFELACQRDCIYLTGVSDAGMVDDGSKDLTEISSFLGRLYPSGAIPDAALVHCLRVVLIARFYIWKQVRPVTRLTWLFKQMYFRYLKYPGSDPWLDLTREIFGLFQTARDLEASAGVLRLMLHELQVETEWNGIVVIDECHELSRLLEKRFLSETRNEVNRSMLDRLLVSFREVDCRKLVVSGTGRHLIRLISSLPESVKNRLSYSMYTDLGEFSSADSMKQFTLQYLDNVDDFDFTRIVEVYRGRFRIFVTVLEMFIKASDTQGLVATDYFLRTWHRLSSEPGSALSINRLVWDDVVKFFASPTFHAGCWDIVITVLILQAYTGLPARIAVEDSDLQLVQAGIGRIRSNVEKPLHFKPGTDFFPSSRKVELSICTVEIGEPIVLRALWNFLTSTGDIQKKLINNMGACSESELGVKFEPYSTLMLRKILEKAAVDFVPKLYKSRVSEVFKRPLTVPNSGNFQHFVSMPPKDDGQCFLNWLTDFERWVNGDEKHSFRPFMHSGELTCFGPDMVAGCIGEVDGKKVPVIALFQHKVTNDISISGVLDTLDVDELFLHRKSPKTRSATEEECVDKLKHMLQRGGLLKWIICLPVDVSALQKNRVYGASLFKIHTNKQPFQKMKSEGLVGILDKNMQVMLEESAWFVDAVEHLKHCKRV